MAFTLEVKDLDSITVIVDNTVMIVADTYELTIDELSHEIVRLLKVNNLFAAHQDNRVSAAPDMRTIRYYSSLGLIDRPTIQGRVAKYNRRHVLQLLAIKTLQGAALPLSEIQERVYGLSEAELESVVSSYCSSEDTGVTGANGTSRDSIAFSFRTVQWREIVIEPGLKILADESWQQTHSSIIQKDQTDQTEQALLESKIRAALETLKAVARRANGEIK